MKDMRTLGYVLHDPAEVLVGLHRADLGATAELFEFRQHALEVEKLSALESVELLQRRHGEALRVHRHALVKHPKSLPIGPKRALGLDHHVVLVRRRAAE